MRKTIPDNLKGKSTSSQLWLTRQLNDPYVRKARYENYRCRSAFKLIEIDDKYNIIKPGMIVIDCGAAPGSWTQVLVKRLELTGDQPFKTGAVISIDIRPFSPVEGAIIMPAVDFTKPLNQANILHALNGKKVDLICSDMAPNTTGIKELDHDAIVTLCYSVLQFGTTVLKHDTGVCLVKFFDGNRTSKLLNDFEKFFHRVDIIKPLASRGDSAESFVLAREFKGIIN